MSLSGGWQPSKGYASTFCVSVEELIYQSVWSRGPLRGYQLEFFGPLCAVQPDILMIRLGFQRLRVLAT